MKELKHRLVILNKSIVQVKPYKATEARNP